jgi:hypothetical protein
LRTASLTSARLPDIIDFGRCHVTQSLSLCIIVALLAAPLVVSGADAQSGRPGSAGQTFWFSRPASESFAQAVDQDVRQYPGDYSTAKAVLSHILARLNGGAPVGALPGAYSPAQQRTQLQEALAGLPSPTHPHQR